MAKEGYVNGSDLLFMVEGKAVGHCSKHTTTYTSETKERSVKPVATEAIGSAGLFKGKSVTSLKVSVKAEGVRFYADTESGFKDMLKLWKAGKSIECKGFERGNDATPYMSGKFVFTSLEESNPAQDDATYSVGLDNDGVITIDETKIDYTAAG